MGRPAASHLRREAARGWAYPLGLQHPEGVDVALGASFAGGPAVMLMRSISSWSARSLFETSAGSSICLWNFALATTLCLMLCMMVSLQPGCLKYCRLADMRTMDTRRPFRKSRGVTDMYRSRHK